MTLFRESGMDCSPVFSEGNLALWENLSGMAFRFEDSVAMNSGQRGSPSICIPGTRFYFFFSPVSFLDLDSPDSFFSLFFASSFSRAFLLSCFSPRYWQISVNPRYRPME